MHTPECRKSIDNWYGKFHSLLIIILLNIILRHAGLYWRTRNYWAYVVIVCKYAATFFSEKMPLVDEKFEDIISQMLKANQLIIYKISSSTTAHVQLTRPPRTIEQRIFKSGANRDSKLTERQKNPKTHQPPNQTQESGTPSPASEVGRELWELRGGGRGARLQTVVTLENDQYVLHISAILYVYSTINSYSLTP